MSIAEELWKGTQSRIPSKRSSTRSIEKNPKIPVKDAAEIDDIIEENKQHVNKRVGRAHNDQ